MLEDTIMRVSEDGAVLEEFSIPKLMQKNGLGAVLSANGGTFGMRRVGRAELVHANKAAELPSEIADAFPMFDAGDLAISMRDLNLVMVIDPVAKKVKWHQTGPWLRQHDAEFRSDGRLSIFNNNVYRTAYVGEQTVLTTPRTTNIIAVDPESRETEVIVGQSQGQELLSVIRGDHQLLGESETLITEFDAGRVLETDERGQIVWEFVNSYDEDFVGEITNSAVFPADYFETDWAACDS